MTPRRTMMGETMTKSKGPEALPATALQAELVSQSFNVDDGTVDVIWSTGPRVRFFDWEIGEYDLTLGLEQKNVDLKFARQGAPVLDAHAGYSIRNVVGVVQAIEVDGKQGTATLRLSNRDDVAGIRQDVAGGIIRHVSVGTRLVKLRDITEDGDKVPHYYADRHEVLEISLAPIPRDRGAVVQGEKGGERFPVELVTESAQAARGEDGTTMDPNTPSAATAANEITPPAVTMAAGSNGAPTPAPEGSRVDQAQIAQAQEAERARCLEIQTVCTQSRLPDATTLAAGWIQQGTDIGEVRRLLLDRLATQSDAVGIRSGVSVITDEGDTIRQSVASTILNRIAPSVFALELRGREFVGMSLLEIGRDLLARHGVSTRGLSRMEVAKQALHGTSDFPEILANVAGKTLRGAYEQTPRTFLGWCKQATLPDFKQVSRTQLGEAPTLALVSPNGEFTTGTMGEAAEKYALATYGRIIGFTRQAIVNDDLSAFSRIVTAFGSQAANLQSDIVYAILTANPNMADGSALFVAGHNNISGGASVISITSLGAGYAVMQKQKGIDGATILNVIPRSLIVPAALRTVALQYVAQITPESSGNVNPFTNSLDVVVEPRLDASSASVWYMAANPNAIDTIEFGFLDGESGPAMDSRVGFDVDGVEFKCRLDFAAKAIDWRGLYRNAA
jgi:hypothetical protein